MNQSQPFPFMKYKWIYFAISLFVLIPGLISLILFGLRLSIDFTGGTLLEIQSASASAQLTPQVIESVAGEMQLESLYIQPSDNGSFILRLKPITQQQNEAFKTALAQETGPIIENRFETVGPTVGAELARKALLAVIFSSFCIVAYIAWSFRHIPRPYTSWKFGVSAIVALLHDVFVVIGLFSIFGHFYHVEIDALFVTAILTVIGFSVHDTIVVFDRIRENLPKLPKATFSQVVDFSLTETLARSLNTSLTVTLTLTALLLFGGETTRWFVMALLVGIISGTFSSIFNAAPILVLWEEKSAHRS